MTSIRRQLLVGLVTSVLSAGIVASAVVFFQARAEANGLFDYQLRQVALALRDRSFFRGELDRVLQGEEARDFVVQVWAPDGTRLYTSDERAPVPEVVRLGFDTFDAHGMAWRVFGIQQRGLTFLVGQPLAVRNQLALDAAAHTLLPFLVVLPLMALLIWLVIGRGFREFEATTLAVGRRSPDSLEPVPVDSAPDEVRPLIEALNGLLERLADALARERRFVADAAHELRTPLTALRLQLQLAERAAEGPGLETAHAQLREGIARASRLVGQLLTLARVDPQAAAAPAEPVDLERIIRDVIAGRSVIAAESGIVLASRVQGDVQVAGEPDSLRTLVENLVDNALRHAPRGGHVDVSARRDGNALLVVEDDGPGIPPSERERVFDRFYRGAHAAEGGSGLGLAIVQRIAERHGASVSLGDAQGHATGLRAVVAFP